ncbi:MAG: energy transducer TonB [Candidatus Acidiferrales bacterium]
MTVQGATHVEGTDQRQLFTEATKTTIVFDNGAVVNLKAKVALGQCVFLRNEKSGREILCKVIEWRPGGLGGYTDLEFTSRDPKFWEAPTEQPAAATPTTEVKAVAPAPEARPATEVKVATDAQAEVRAQAPTENPSDTPQFKYSTQSSAMTFTPPAESVAAAPVILPTQASQALSEESSEPGTAESHPEQGDQPEWNGANDGEMLAALMAGDTKSKPKREFVADSSDGDISVVDNTESVVPAEPAFEEISQDAGPSRVAAAGAKVISILAGVTGKIREIDPGKNAVTIGIAASVLLAAVLGVAWHVKRRSSLNANSRSTAAQAAPAQSGARVQTAALQTSPAPAPATASVIPASTGSTLTNTSANAAAGNASNAASGSAPSSIDASAPPAPATGKVQPTNAAKASSPASTTENASFDEPTVVAEKRLKLKRASAGETIPARIVSQAPPAVPSWAKKLDLDPVVRLDAVIDSHGNLTQTKPLSGPRLLQGEAERAVALWIFEPALTDGKPITTHMVLTVEFQR